MERVFREMKKSGKIRLKIRIIGLIERIIGEKIEIEVPEGINVSDLARILFETFREKIEREKVEIAFKDFHAQNLILVNGKEISALEGLGTILKDNDEILIVNLTRGG